jgi:hypothetical protein
VHDTAQRAAEIMAILTGDGPDQRDRIVEVLRAHDEPEPIDISAADLAGLRAAASELRAVFTATDTAEAATHINLLLARHAHPPRLTTHGGQSGWHLHVDGDDDAPWGEWFITSSCLALAVLLTERGAPPAGICASPSCGTPFVNTSRGTPRRYCSPGCANRERVAAYRARMREPDLLPLLLDTVATWIPPLTLI